MIGIAAPGSAFSDSPVVKRGAASFDVPPGDRSWRESCPSSTQEKLKRVRTPRVHITYDVETEGARVVKELPFVMGVIGDFSGRIPPSNSAAGRTEVRRDQPRQLRRCHEADGAGLQMRVENTIEGDGTTIPVQLAFNSMSDFEPASIIQQVEPLQKAARDAQPVAGPGCRRSTAARSSRAFSSRCSRTAATFRSSRRSWASGRMRRWRRRHNRRRGCRGRQNEVLDGRVSTWPQVERQKQADDADELESRHSLLGCGHWRHQTDRTRSRSRAHSAAIDRRSAQGHGSVRQKRHQDDDGCGPGASTRSSPSSSRRSCTTLSSRSSRGPGVGCITWSARPKPASRSSCAC